MDNRTNPSNADPAFGAGGGAVDDLTPPTMKGSMQTIPMAPPPGVASNAAPAQPSGDEMDRTMVGPTQTLPFPAKPAAKAPSSGTKPVVIPTMAAPTVASGAKTGVSPSSLTGQDVATIVGDVPMQDLSSEQLLRDAPRLESCGQICPALNGIPLLYKLGQGGMGAVYYGIHPRLRSEVAVKVLPFHLAQQDPGMIQRFFREAQIAAKVRSPHLVNCIDVNEESGLFFLVMEFVPGVTVGSYLKKAIEGGSVGMAELEAIDVCLAACLGLDAAHSNGVIHRDLKPDNIMIPYKSRQTKSFDIKSSKLMDLGLARNEEGNQSLTGVQAAMGTPGYMAPEQALDAKTADKRSDVFSMGATLYAMLTGRPPFKGEVVMKVLMATMHEPHAPITNLRPDLSPGLVQLIDRCLDKRAENRYSDARSLIRGLKAVRKVLSPDGAFGGEDEGGSEEATEESRPAPLIATITDGSAGAGKKKGLMFAAGGVGLAACLAIGAFMAFGGKKPIEVPVEKKIVQPDVPPLEESKKKYVTDKHNRSIDTVKQYIGLKQFDQADQELQDMANFESQYSKQLPDLAKDMTDLRATFESAKKEDAFNNLAIQVDLQLKSNNVDEAKSLATKLDPVTPAQIEIKAKKQSEINKIEQKTKNKGEFDQTLYKAKDEKLTLDDRIGLATKALKLIDGEPHALELMRTLKALKTKEENDTNYKKQFTKALQNYNSKNYEVANTAIKAARALRSGDKDALELQNKIVAEAGDRLKKQFEEEAKKTAFEAFTKAQDFYAKKDSANALVAIKEALANVATNDQYLSFKTKIELLMQEEERVLEVAQKKSSFDDYYKEANENLDLAKDVRGIAFLDNALDRIEDATQLKLEAPSLYNPEDPKSTELLKGMIGNLAALKTKVLARQADLKTRIQYDAWVLDATKILAQNDSEFDSKLESVDSGLKMVGDALKVLDAGKVVTPEEGKIAQDLKTKLTATREKVVARDAKRADVASLVAKGDDAMKARKFDDALASFKKANDAVRVLSEPEKDAVSRKMQAAVTGQENARKVTNMLLATDKLNSDEKYEEALKQVDDAINAKMDDPRLIQKKADYEAGKTAILKLTQETRAAAQDALKAANLDGAVEALEKEGAKHPNRLALVDPMNDLKRIQGTIKETTATLEKTLADAKIVNEKVRLRGSDGYDKVRKANKEMPKLKAEVVAKLGAEGFEKSWKTANDFSLNAGNLVELAKTGLAFMNGVSAQIDAENKKPEPKVETDQQGTKPRANTLEAEPK